MIPIPLLKEHGIQKRIRKPLLQIIQRPVLLTSNTLHRVHELRNRILIRDTLQMLEHILTADAILLPVYTT